MPCCDQPDVQKLYSDVKFVSCDWKLLVLRSRVGLRLHASLPLRRWYQCGLDCVCTILTTFYHNIIMNHYGATGHVVKFSYKDIITSILLYSQIQKSMLMFLISMYLRSNLRLRSVSLSTLVLLNKWWSPLRLDRRLDHLTQLQVCNLSSYDSAHDWIISQWSCLVRSQP